MSSDERRTMGMLRRSADVLQLVAARGSLSVAELAGQVGMPRASVYRLVEALVQARLLEVAPDSRVKVSLRSLRLGDVARAGLAEWTGARDVLDALSDRTGQTTYLSVPVGDRALCIDWSRGRGISVLALKPGRTLPLYAGAAGRVTLAFRAEPLADYLRNAPFAAFTTRTLTTAAELWTDTGETRERGFSVSDEDVTIGIGALGAPLRSPDGTLLGALSVAGLAADFRQDQAALAAALRHSAEELVAQRARPGRSGAAGLGAGAVVPSDGDDRGCP